MSQHRGRPKRFAPLDPKKINEAGAPPLKGIVFDVDGTLWYVRLSTLTLQLPYFLLLKQISLCVCLKRFPPLRLNL